VRSSLSKEGFRLEQPDTVGEDRSSYKLSANDALQWLSRRRGFIPNATDPSPDRHRIAIRETLADLSIPFPTAVTRTAELAGLSDMKGSGIDPEWYVGLVEGLAVVPDVEALVALAAALDVPPADFAARGGVIFWSLKRANAWQMQWEGGAKACPSSVECSVFTLPFLQDAQRSVCGNWWRFGS
tara:strand:- start:695 stop:1246 length:552 start_codon:yes stop_codon:yes gene_type:complete